MAAHHGARPPGAGSSWMVLAAIAVAITLAWASTSWFRLLLSLATISAVLYLVLERLLKSFEGRVFEQLAASRAASPPPAPEAAASGVDSQSVSGYIESVAFQSIATRSDVPP